MPELSNEELVTKSSIYREFIAERDEVLRYKWIRSEEVGHDIGFEKALIDWTLKHREDWRKGSQKRQS